MTSTTNESTANIASADIIRLALAHLTESGLHATCTKLRQESNLGMAGIFPTSKGRLLSCAEEGRWGEVLEIIECLDVERYRKNYLEDYCKSKELAEGQVVVTPLEKALALVHEMTVLELADHGEYELAYATLRMCSEMLDKSLPSSNEHDMDDDQDAKESGNSGSLGIITSRTGDIERRITALTSLRSAPLNGGGAAINLPPNYYGPLDQTQQKRRIQIAHLLKHHVPELPLQRLSSLLQQSIKWQCHTGLYPSVQKLFQDEDNQADENEGDLDANKKKKKRKKHVAEQKFDLVLGNVDILLAGSKKKYKSSSGKESGERIPSRPTQTIRLGKKSYIESAMFLPDGKGLITGSTDGFIEIWGEPINSRKDGGGLELMTQTEIDFEKLRTSDLPFQKSDDLMVHDAPVIAMNVSNDGALLGSTSSDGTVCVWKIMDGKLLRKIERAHGGSGVGGDKGAAVSCIQFSPDGSKILTGGHDYTCREFGLLANRMLKEFRAHKSYVNCCSYVTIASAADGKTTNSLYVVTGSADGKVIVWDAKTSEPLREIAPPIPLSSTAAVDESQSIVSLKSIHTVLHLHSPPQSMIVVPRTDRAYLMSYTGAIVRVFTRDDVQNTEFLAASVSPSNQWLYIAADDGKCVVFDVTSGSVEKIIRSFAEECSTRSDKASDITGVLHHPHRGMVGGFCNDKGQKRGILTLWK